MDNYTQYLQRMTDSFNRSSKGLIPFFIQGTKILDVGCGSGVLMEALEENQNLEITGLDINPDAIDVCKKKSLDAVCCTLEDYTKVSPGTFDTVVFSSVLHEFSSFDKSHRFMAEPIIEAIGHAKTLLKNHGRIIIRDGIKESSMLSKDMISVEALDIDTINALERYSHDVPTDMFHEHESKYVIKHARDSYIITSFASFLKEFMYTYTWGNDSYEREVKEKFGILTVGEWIRVCEGLNIKNIMISSEEYKKHLSKHFNPDTLKMFDRSSILIVADK